MLHESGWRFLMLKGKFVTRLMVEEDHENRVMRFELLPYPHERSILSKFHGRPPCAQPLGAVRGLGDCCGGRWE